MLSFTKTNRTRILVFLIAISLISLLAILIGLFRNAKTIISKDEAVQDLDQLKGIISKRSAYVELKNFRYDSVIDSVGLALPDEISVVDLGFILQSIVGRIGDRHAGVSEFEEKDRFDYFLPFALAPAPYNEDREGVYALRSETKNDSLYFDYFLSGFPKLKSLEQLGISELIRRTGWEDYHAGYEAKKIRVLEDLQRIKKELYKIGIPLNENTVRATFTNGVRDTVITIPLSQKQVKWVETPFNYINARQSPYHFSVMRDGIAYLRISEMFGLDDEKTFAKELRGFFEEIKTSRSLIIDLRNNSGGNRDILTLIAPYIINKADRPYVANLVRVRKHNASENLHLSGRYLFPYGSTHFSSEERLAIDKFMSEFSPKLNCDTAKYSEYYFMILPAKNDTSAYFYDKPVYILVNEVVFSAASVFVCSLKDLPNIYVAGEKCGASSGRSTTLELKNSRINIKLSTMVSFQRNGDPLDATEIHPDIYLPRDEPQILGIRDSQLKGLIEFINNKGFQESGE